MKLPTALVARTYLEDLAFMAEKIGTREAFHPLQFHLLDDRLRSDLRGVDAVLRDAHEMHAAHHIWVRHTYACWRALQDPGATCICRPWSRK
ncbi:MAG: hypothetical protein Q8L48_16830 [Archangium sp.]|nr:hypothetical protein [Archangium sp.]